MRLAEFIARRDVSHACAQVQILEPRRFADMEMIDRVQIVMEAGQRHFSCAQSAAIGETPLHEQNVEAGAGKIAAEDQPVVAGADDDAVIGFFERLRQRLDVLSVGPRSGARAARLPGGRYTGQWPLLHGRRAGNSLDIEFYRAARCQKYSSLRQRWTFWRICRYIRL